jgi:HK97 family phage prohead protease
MNRMDMERRAAPLELRAAGRRLEGYAALFETEARIGGFTETIAPGAFAASLTRNDVLALMDHDQTRLLGRSRSGTLRLTEDSKGLAFSIDAPDTQLGKDTLALAERGDLGGMSFGFLVPEGGEQWSGDRRTLRAVDLREISIVSAWPAYNGTTVIARHRTHEPARLHLARLWLATCR